MFRAAVLSLSLIAAHSLTGGSLFAQSCACPPPSCVAPSCAVPSDCYFAPTCAAPGTCNGSCQAAPSCGGCEKCCKAGKGRWIHIDLSRTINKGDKIKKNSGGFMGEAPPVGATVVMSTPAQFTSFAAMPISFQAAAPVDQSATIAALTAALKANAAAPAAAAAAAAPANSKCEDPCGDIKQLQSDVQQLKQIVVNLTNVVEDMNKKAP